MYTIEVCAFNTNDSLHGPKIFLWTERIIAVIFTIEYFYRAFRHNGGWKYVFSGQGFLDAISVIPFWVGFKAHDKALHMIRSLRILRLFKLWRYSEGMQAVSRAFEIAIPRLLPVAQLVFVVLMIGSTFVYECERCAQPNMFKSFGDALWWGIVTLTTVGYGDTYPITIEGRMVASVFMMCGIGLVALLFGISSDSFAQQLREKKEREGQQAHVE